MFLKHKQVNKYDDRVIIHHLNFVFKGMNPVEVDEELGKELLKLPEVYEVNAKGESVKESKKPKESKEVKSKEVKKKKLF